MRNKWRTHLAKAVITTRKESVCRLSRPIRRGRPPPAFLIAPQRPAPIVTEQARFPAPHNSHRVFRHRRQPTHEAGFGVERLSFSCYATNEDRTQRVLEYDFTAHRPAPGLRLVTASIPFLFPFSGRSALHGEPMSHSWMHTRNFWNEERFRSQFLFLFVLDVS